MEEKYVAKAKVEFERDCSDDGRIREFYERFIGVMVASKLDRLEQSAFDSAIPTPFSSLTSEWLRKQPIKNGYFRDGTPIPDKDDYLD